MTNEEAPGIEYFGLNNRFFATFFAVFRMSLGDNDMGALAFMEDGNIAMFWITWLLISIICQIFLLNFIIAELSHSYEVVMEAYDRLAVQQYTTLVSESDEMLPWCFRYSKTQNPRYLVIRKRLD